MLVTHGFFFIGKHSLDRVEVFSAPHITSPASRPWDAQEAGSGHSQDS